MPVPHHTNRSIPGWNRPAHVAGGLVRLTSPRASALQAWRALAALLLAAAIDAHAAFPDRPIRLIVPFAPSGTVDGIARLTGVEFGKALCQPLVIENRPGSGGTIGIMAAAAAAPDGYTLLLGNIALASAPALYPKSGIRLNQFEPVALIGKSAYVLAVKNAFPANSVAKLVALAKDYPGKYNYSSAGAGSAIHLAAELFKSRASIDVVHVPYKGAGPATTALLSGEVDMMFGSIGEMKPLIISKRVRPLAVTSAARARALPDVPTLAEAGIGDYDVAGWYGVYAPARVPPDILHQLQAAATTALQSPAMLLQLARYQMEPAKSGPKEAGDILDAEARRWTEVIHHAGISAE
jgi:tripartite-type tricarboxylate transporter receptor subunit TctC